MNCVVTAGPTFEPLDEVRRLTNISTGRLGIELANFLAGRGHEVTLLLGQQATWRGERLAGQAKWFGTTKDLQGQLAALAGRPIDAVFHAAAVSDFAFGKVWERSAKGELTELSARKLSTRLEQLLVELIPTPKVIRQLREWWPRACLVGWKYEVEGDAARAVAQAEQQLIECRTNGCVANGPAYGLGFGLVTGPGQRLHLDNAEGLYVALESLALSVRQG